MVALKISELTQRNIVSCVGKSFQSIVELSPEDERKLIGKNVSFSKKVDLRKVGKGNSLLSRGKIKSMDDIDSRLMKIK